MLDGKAPRALTVIERWPIVARRHRARNNTDARPIARELSSRAPPRPGARGGPWCGGGTRGHGRRTRVAMDRRGRL